MRRVQKEKSGGPKERNKKGARLILRLSELAGFGAKCRQEGKRVVFTNGCFDLLHPGHVWLFYLARKLGEVLIVAVNSDSSLRRLKGPSRPIFRLKERLEILAAIEAIDVLTVFKEDTPKKIISLLQPDILVKGGDWPPDGVVGREEVEAAGGRVVLIPYLPGLSTSQLLQRISQSQKMKNPFLEDKGF